MEPPGPAFGAGPIINLSVIRERLFPHYAEFIIGPAEGRTRWLHAGYEAQDLLRLGGVRSNLNP
jgi:hypothetical protein